MQRLVLARALYSQPKLLLCDEVTANLDKTTAQKVLANLRGGDWSGVCHPLAGGGGLSRTALHHGKRHAAGE